MALDEAVVEARLRAFYETHNPGNEQNIAEIVRKYRGKEAALCARLKKKYGVAPDLETPSTTTPPAATSSNKTTPAATATTSAVYDSAYVPMTASPAAEDALDFRSSSFDALRALQSRHTQPPVAGVLPLDNIFKCRHLLPATDVNFVAALSTVKKAPPSSSAKRPPSDQPAARTPALFQQLADTYLDGPFSVLRRCFLARRRVRVVIRRVNSVRGTCSGFLKAFDKHMNLVLLDVREVFIPPAVYNKRDRHEATPVESALFSVADEGRNRAFTVRSHAKQLFVRGDNVVMVMEEVAAVKQVTSDKN